MFEWLQSNYITGSNWGVPSCVTPNFFSTHSWITEVCGACREFGRGSVGVFGGVLSQLKSLDTVSVEQ